MVSWNRGYMFKAEKLITVKNGWMVAEGNGVTPTRRHQAEEELLMFQKRFAALIYIQKDKERVNY